jgi:hypothetical protein
MLLRCGFPGLAWDRFVVGATSTKGSDGRACVPVGAPSLNIASVSLVRCFQVSAFLSIHRRSGHSSTVYYWRSGYNFMHQFGPLSGTLKVVRALHLSSPLSHTKSQLVIAQSLCPSCHSCHWPKWFSLILLFLLSLASEAWNSAEDPNATAITFPSNRIFELLNSRIWQKNLVGGSGEPAARLIFLEAGVSNERNYWNTLVFDSLSFKSYIPIFGRVVNFGPRWSLGTTKHEIDCFQSGVAHVYTVRGQGKGSPFGVIRQVHQ